MKKINNLFYMAIIALVGLFIIVPVNAETTITLEGEIISESMIRLSWEYDGTEQVDHYDIYEKYFDDNGEKIDSSITDIAADSDSLIINSVDSNYEYSFYIVATLENGDTVQSENVRATTSNLRIQADNNKGNVFLYWEDANEEIEPGEITYYNIYMKHFDDEGNIATDRVSYVDAGETTYDLYDLKKNNLYGFYVIATLKNGDTIQSNTSWVINEEGLNFEFVEIGKTEAYFSWTYDKSYYGSLKNFKIFQYDDSLNDWVQIGQTNTGSDYRANNIKYNDGIWHFKITATNESGETLSTETGMQKAPQFGLTGEFIEGNKLKLSWDYNGEYGAASSYEIYDPNHNDDEPLATVTDNSYIVEDIKENEKYVFSVYPVVPGDKIVRSNNLHILKNSTIDVSGINDVEYDGSQKDMDISVDFDESGQFANRGKRTLALASQNIRMPLEKNTDYSVNYANNTDAGTAKIIIKGKGIFAGTVTKTFKINPKNITSGVSISGISNKTYNGKAQTQKLVLKYNNNTLVEGKDYNVVYTNNKNAGTAMVTIVGINNYTGMTRKTFKINKIANPLTVKTTTKSVKYTKVKKAKQVVAPITVTKKQGTVTFIKQKGSSTKLSINKTTGKITVKKGTKKGTYKIKVKINASGNVNYKAKYLIKTIKVRVK